MPQVEIEVTLKSSGIVPSDQYRLLLFSIDGKILAGYYSGSYFKEIVPDYERGAAVRNTYRSEQVKAWCYLDWMREGNSTDGKVVCSTCGSMYYTGTKFCGYCGTKIKGK